MRANACSQLDSHHSVAAHAAPQKRAQCKWLAAAACPSRSCASIPEAQLRAAGQAGDHLISSQAGSLNLRERQERLALLSLSPKRQPKSGLALTLAELCASSRCAQIAIAQSGSSSVKQAPIAPAEPVGGSRATVRSRTPFCSRTRSLARVSFAQDNKWRQIESLSAFASELNCKRASLLADAAAVRSWIIEQSFGGALCRCA